MNALSGKVKAVVSDKEDVRLWLGLNSYQIGFFTALICDAVQEFDLRGQKVPDDILSIYDALILEFNKPYVEEMEKEMSLKEYNKNENKANSL